MLTEKQVLARIHGLSKPRLRVCIEESWVTPAKGEGGHMFDEVDLARLHLIADLRRDMGVNDDAVPIILSLVDQLHAAERRLRLLDRALSGQGKDIRTRIITYLQAEIGENR